MTNEVVKKPEPRELFKDIIGQSAAKRRINFYLNGYNDSHIFPNTLLVSPKGCGKSLIAKEIAKGLIEFDELGNPVINSAGLPARKTYLEINCSVIQSVKDFIESVIVPHVDGKNVTLFLDESSELPHDVVFTLLTMLNPNNKNRNTFIYGNFSCEIDFRKQTFILASSESDKIFHALLNRLTRIDLETYKPDDLIKIILKNTPDVEYENGVLDDMATVVRKNARSAVMLAKDVLTYLRGSKLFLNDDWKELKGILGIYPLGLNINEITALKHLAERPMGSSLTMISAKLGMSRDAVQKDLELVLQSASLMEIQSGKGRILTKNGMDYLKRLEQSA